MTARAVPVQRAPQPTRDAARGVTQPGRPLDDAVRIAAERRLGHSFADVRVHTDAGAADAARGMGAAAFTLGRSIAFGPGYRPDTARGRAILSHELVHVAQQQGGGTAPPGAAQEREARAAAWLPEGPQQGAFAVRERSAVGVACLTVAELERGLWARVPDSVKPYVRPLALQARAELDKVVPPTTEIPSAAVEAVAHPVEAVKAAAVATVATVGPKVVAVLPKPPTSLPALAQHAKKQVRDHLMEAAGTAKGVVLEAGNIVDTLAWLPYAGHQLLEKVAEGHPLAQEALAAGDVVTGYSAEMDFARRYGLVDPQTGAPAVSGRLSKGIDTAVEGGDRALFGAPHEDAWLLTPYEQGELKGAVAAQVGLAFVGVEEVQLALKVVGALGGAKGIYDSVKRNPGGWYKSPDFWASLIGLAMSVVGLRATKASGKLTQLLLRSGAVLNAVPAVWKLVADYDDKTLAADPKQREAALKADVVAIVKIVANAVADAARAGAHPAAAPEGGTPAPPHGEPATGGAAVHAGPAAPAAALPEPVAPHGAAPSAAAPPPVLPETTAVPGAGILRPLTAPLHLPVVEGAGPVPRGLQPGSIGTYERAVPNPHPFALDSNPPGAPGATRGGGRLPQGGRAAARMYAEHQTPAAVAHEVLPNHELHGPGGERRGGRDTKEAVAVMFPEAAKAHKDAADARLLREVKARKAAGEAVAPVEVIARGAQHSLDATAQPGAAVPPEQITKTFLAEQDQFFSERYGYVQKRPGQAPPAPPAGAPHLPDEAAVNAHLDAAFEPHVAPKPPPEATATTTGHPAPEPAAPPARRPAPPDTLPDGTIVIRNLEPGDYLHRITSARDAVRTREAMIRDQPHLELDLWRDRRTGERVIIQGHPTETSYAMLRTDPDLAQGHWTLERHYHPPKAGDMRRRLASGEDYRAQQRRFPGGEDPGPVRTVLDWVDPETGTRHRTRFSHDPAAPEPFAITYRDNDGVLQTRRWAQPEQYYQFQFDFKGSGPDAMPEPMPSNRRDGRPPPAASPPAGLTMVGGGPGHAPPAAPGPTPSPTLSPAPAALPSNEGAHQRWVARTLRRGLGRQDAPKVRRNAPPLEPGTVSPRTMSIHKALRTFDDVLARSPGREVGLFRHSVTGEYIVVAGEGSAVAPPSTSQGDWVAVKHNHPITDATLLYRQPAPADVDQSATASVLFLGRQPHTAFVEHMTPDGKRQLTAYTVKPQRVTKPGDSPATVTLQWVDKTGTLRTQHFGSFDAYAKYYQSHKVWAPVGSAEHAMQKQVLVDHIARLREIGDLPPRAETAKATPGP